MPKVPEMDFSGLGTESGPQDGHFKQNTHRPPHNEWDGYEAQPVATLCPSSDNAWANDPPQQKVNGMAL